METRMKFAAILALALALSASPALAQPHNIIIFVADGLRYGSVEPGNMPNMTALKTQGVDFTNSHSLYPTITTVNASAIATGHYIGDTGDFGNTLYIGQPMASLKGGIIGFLENDDVLTEMNSKFGGNYLNETTLIAAARAAGWQTAVIGKLGPSRIQDSTAAADGSETVIVDDATGHDGGLGLPAWFTAEMGKAFFEPKMPRTAVPNFEQEANMMKAATRIVLPHFKENGKPFVMLFWSRDPDMSQHNTRDSLGETVPGINGPTAMAGARNADTMLGELRASLKDEGLDATTDIFVTADHGFTTVTHATPSQADVPAGFLSRDIGTTMDLPVKGAFVGADPDHPDVVVAANGGSDLVYLPGKDTKKQARKIVKALAAKDYVSGIFVNDRLGKIPGTLAMSDVNLMGAARTPQPAIYVNFLTSSSGCDEPPQCAVEMGDTPLQTGQGSHGSFSRAETRNFMAATGPDFKTGFADPAPVSNADIAPTLAHLMGLDIAPRGKLTGRVIGEALIGGAPVTVERRIVSSDPGPDGIRTWLDEQLVGATRYFDAAGFEGRTVGLVTH
jgi:arylsulfatase A-like enzyme